MGRVFAILIVGLAVGLAYVWLLPGFSIAIGGPDRSTIQAQTRAALMGPPGASSPEQVARIQPKGLCRAQGDGRFACGVAVIMGDRTETMVITLRKDASGQWQPVP